MQPRSAGSPWTSLGMYQKEHTDLKARYTRVGKNKCFLDIFFLILLEFFPVASLDATGYNLVFDPRRNSYGGSFCFIVRQTKQEFRSLDVAAQRSFCSCIPIGQGIYVLLVIGRLPLQKV